ncbi:ribonucleoside triphosphate reductase [Candidatus Micrarchaeota archaeon CG1_02_51_15]|nr:MAG: ribonucleoside triphosphate reductase [Candidatus Micrarchaeota archaeon CG1_02_51_15]
MDALTPDREVRKIRKRDGRVIPYERGRIVNAVFKAAEAVGGKDRERAEQLATQVESVISKQFKPGEIPAVEEVQDVVEKVLIENGHFKTAKAYILYRKQRSDLRNLATVMGNVGTVEEYLLRSDWRVNENANMGYSLQGLNNYVSAKVIANYWLEKVYAQPAADAHRQGIMHIHDLCTLGAYCVGWDLFDLLNTGFGHVEGKVKSLPPKHFRSALGQAVNFFYTLQGESAGAQAFSSFDTYLAPFIRADKLDYAQVKQAMQEFIFNMSVPTRVGFQTPFTNVTLDLAPPKFIANSPAVVGGKPADFAYGDLQPEMDLFNTAFAEVMEEGDADGRVFTFPIPTYNITKDFDWESPVSQSIFELTAKYGVPYFANYVNSDMKPEDSRSMCCRLRIDNRELHSRGGGLFGANPLTGSIGVVTLNLPRLAFSSKNEDEFFEKLLAAMVLAKESLEAKRKTIDQFTEDGLYPYSKFYLRSIKQSSGSYWKNHFSTIGIVGMNEALMNLFGKNIASDEGQAFALKTMDFMRKHMMKFQEETGNLYNLEATPAEGCSYRLARMDRKKNPEMAFANSDAVRKGAEPFYTNSTHLPVNYTDDVFEAIELQDSLQCKYTGGTVLHGFIGERLHDWRSAGELVKKVFANNKLPYFSVTPTFSICNKHGYLEGEQFNCPKCDAEVNWHNNASPELESKRTRCEVYSRIVGYIRPIQQWNAGKKAEYAMRTPYSKQLDARKVG